MFEAFGLLSLGGQIAIGGARNSTSWGCCPGRRSPEGGNSEPSRASYWRIRPSIRDLEPSIKSHSCFALSDGAKVIRAPLGVAFESRPIDRNKAEFWLVAGFPFEII